MLKTYKCYIQPTCGNVSIVAKGSTPGLSEVVHRSQVGQTPSCTWAIEAPAPGLLHTSENPSGPSLVTVLLPHPHGVRRPHSQYLGPTCPRAPKPASELCGASFPDPPPMKDCASGVYTLGLRTDQELAVCRVCR